LVRPARVSRKVAPFLLVIGREPARQISLDGPLGIGERC
jgi:hypothetical protein